MIPIFSSFMFSYPATKRYLYWIIYITWYSIEFVFNNVCLTCILYCVCILVSLFSWHYCCKKKLHCYNDTTVKRKSFIVSMTSLLEGKIFIVFMTLLAVKEKLNVFHDIYVIRKGFIGFMALLLEEKASLFSWSGISNNNIVLNSVCMILWALFAIFLNVFFVVLL